MHDDPTLLRRYVEEGSEAAFTELVRRNLDMVYAAALRRTGGSSHLAADVAQAVFTALAHKSQQLLNSDELLNYDLRTDQSALMLRSRVKLFAMSEDEIRTIYQLQKAFDDRYGPDAMGATALGLSPAERVRQTQDRAANRPALLQQVATALGPERALDYKLATLNGAQQFGTLATRLQLSPEATRQVLQTQASFEEGLAAIRATRATNSEERAQLTQQSAALRDQAIQTVTGILGPSGTEAYKTTGGNWMTTRFNGQ